MILLISLMITIPLGLDLYMPVPETNPMTAEKIELGRQLFFDRRLSRDHSIACVSCHEPSRAFADSRPLSIGASGRMGRRNAPALVNRAYGLSFFWDGRASTLEEQVLRPIEDPSEMDMSVVEASARVGVTPARMAEALASYVRSILSGNSPFDRFSNGERAALTAEQQRGLRIFRGKANCSSCHIGPNFTDERFHNTGVAWRASSGVGTFADEGRFGITGRNQDRGAFKTPTLREILHTAPYMHDGSMASLDEVIAFYDQGGRLNPFLDAELRPLRLTAEERMDLAAFLTSLSGLTLR